MERFIAGIAGLLFGLGLAISGMMDPIKVLGFLDISGEWDPSLACVMAGAIPVAFVGFRLARGRTTAVCGTPFAAPPKARIDIKLIIGAALFGIGWGLAGLCPGPALAALGLAFWQIWLFVAAMLIGIFAHGFLLNTDHSHR